MELIIKDLTSLSAVVPILLEQAGTRNIWCFYGEVGAGKTTLIKEIGKYLGVQEGITSPTYSLVNEYEYISPKTKEKAAMYHLDLYRLNALEEALNIGIEEYLDTKGYCFIEWPALIESILPEEVLKISIAIADDSTRKIVLL